MNKGKIFIITGPSGAGKTEVAKNILLNKSLGIQRVITCTTRAIRPGEVDGEDYFFLTKEEFLKNIKNKAMFEYAQVYGNYYGSRKKDVGAIIDSGKNVLFTVDVKGAINLKKIDRDCKVIFIKAESVNELKKRLIGRNTDAKEVIQKRVDLALAELKMADRFDYIVINFNGKLKDTIKDVENIIKLQCKQIILIEGLPGSGKSTVMGELASKNLIVYEFHTKRKRITKQFGAFKQGKRIIFGNKKVKQLEDKLENIILNSRFIASSQEKIKLDLLREKINELVTLDEKVIFKEGLLGCLIDKNSNQFLSELKFILKNIDTIIFLTLSGGDLKKRQLARIKERKGEYDDTTSKMRQELFIKQFKQVTSPSDVVYVSARHAPRAIIKEILKKVN